MHHLEFEFPVEGVEGKPDYLATIEVVNAPHRPHVGDHVDVEGLRKVLEVRHYYGVPVSNGRETLKEMDYKVNTGDFMTLYRAASAWTV